MTTNQTAQIACLKAVAKNELVRGNILVSCIKDGLVSTPANLPNDYFVTEKGLDLLTKGARK